MAVVASCRCSEERGSLISEAQCGSHHGRSLDQALRCAAQSIHTSDVLGSGPKRRQYGPGGSSTATGLPLRNDGRPSQPRYELGECEPSVRRALLPFSTHLHEWPRHRKNKHQSRGKGNSVRCSFAGLLAIMALLCGSAAHC